MDSDCLIFMKNLLTILFLTAAITCFAGVLPIQQNPYTTGTTGQADARVAAISATNIPFATPAQTATGTSTTLAVNPYDLAQTILSTNDFIAMLNALYAPIGSTGSTNSSGIIFTNIQFQFTNRLDGGGYPVFYTNHWASYIQIQGLVATLTGNDYNNAGLVSYGVIGRWSKSNSVQAAAITGGTINIDTLPTFGVYTNEVFWFGAPNGAYGVIQYAGEIQWVIGGGGGGGSTTVTSNSIAALGTLGNNISGSAATAVTANGLTGWNERVTYYVSPIFGNDTNNGLTRATPLLNYTNAANFAATNIPSTIVLMAGTNVFPLCGADPIYSLIIPPSVNLIGEPGNLVVCINPSSNGTLTRPDMQPCGSNTIQGVNFVFVTPITSDVPLGNFIGPANFLPTDYTLANYPTSMLGVNFKLCTFWFQGTGIHFEGSGDTTLYGWTFDGCKFHCNNNFIQMREKGPLITVMNSEVWLLNWTNNTVFNNKPFRLFETRTLPNSFSNIFPARVINTVIHYADNDMSASNRPVMLMYNTISTNQLVASNVFLLKDCTLDPISITNPASIDLPAMSYNASTQCVLVIQNTSRIDNGGLLTTNAGYPVNVLNSYYSGSFTGNGSGLTNIPSTSIVGGITTNLQFTDTLVGTTNSLYFTNGILMRVTAP